MLAGSRRMVSDTIRRAGLACSGPGEGLDVAELGAQELLAEALEPGHVTGRQPAALRRAGPGVAGQRRAVQQAPHLEGGLVGRGHQYDVTAHDVADRAGHEGVVRADEQPNRERVVSGQMVFILVYTRS